MVSAALIQRKWFASVHRKRLAGGFRQRHHEGLSRVADIADVGVDVRGQEHQRAIKAFYLADEFHSATESSVTSENGHLFVPPGSELVPSACKPSFRDVGETSCSAAHTLCNSSSSCFDPLNFFASSPRRRGTLRYFLALLTFALSNRALLAEVMCGKAEQ